MLSTTNFSTVQTDYGAQGYAQVQSTLFAQQIAAVADNNSNAQDLLLGASGKLHLMVSNQKALDISANVDGSTLIAATNNQAIDISPADVAKTVTLGSLSVSESASTQLLSTTKNVGLEIQEDVKVDNTLIVGKNLVTGGDIFTYQSMNLLRDMNDGTKIGFGFRISDSSNLELYKYNSKNNNHTSTVGVLGQSYNPTALTNSYPTFTTGGGSLTLTQTGSGGSGSGSGSGDGPTTMYQYQFNTNGSSVYLPNGGYLGLGGNSNPAFPLDVIGDINLTGTLRYNGQPYVSSQWTTSNASIKYNSNVQIGGSLVVKGSNVINNIVVNNTLIESSNIAITNTGNGPALSVTQSQTTGQPVAKFVAGATTALYIGSNACVGIGKSNPSYPLDVAGTMSCSNLYVNGLSVSSSGSAANQFTTNGTNVYLPSGNRLGIGKSNLDYSVDVAGDVNVTGAFRVGGSNLANLVGNQVTTSVKISSVWPSYSSIVSAIDSNGQVYSWGTNTFAGLGDGTTVSRAVPTNISAIPGCILSGKVMTQIARGDSHAIALDNQGNVYGWGQSPAYQLGFNGSGTYTSPINLTSRLSLLNGVNIVSVACSGSLTFLLDNNGNVYRWGKLVTNYFPPAKIADILFGRVIVAIATGYNHFMFLDNQGNVYGWGINPVGQIGNFTATGSTSTIVPFTNISAINGSALSGAFITKIACCEYYTVAVDNNNNVYTWGANDSGQLGNNTTTNSNQPIKITSIPGCILVGKTIANISCGVYSVMAIDNNGVIYCWGGGKMLGIGIAPTDTTTFTNALVPVNMSATSSAFSGNIITAIACGYLCNYAIDTNGTLYSWGDPAGNTLGNGVYSYSGVVVTPISIMYYGSFMTGLSNDILFTNFTGQHRCFLDGIAAEEQSEYEGRIVCANKNQYSDVNVAGTQSNRFINGFLYGPSAITINESLPVVSLCSKAQDSNCFGVISMTKDNASSTTLDDIARLRSNNGDNRIQVNSLGEGAIWVCDATGSLESGDYITTSAMAGYGQLQKDGLFHNYTVAKITMDCDFEPPMVPMMEVSRDANGNIVVDENGAMVWVPQMMDSDSQAKAPAYKLRYLQADGTQITQEEYNAAKAADLKAPVYRAAFVGCTYHCG